MDYMNQLDEMNRKGIQLLDEVMDFDTSIVLGGIATMLDEYCKAKGLDVKETWKRINEVADEVHEMFND